VESWPVPPLPAVAGIGQIPRVFDTATAALQPSASGPDARMYVCGITPYDATHMGHAATYVAFDLLQRAWRDAGLTVTYVQNVTDVDDPLLERAQMLGQDWREIAARETALFRDDMAALRVIPPQHYLGVTESLHLIEELIGRLQAAGAAYAVADDLYFPVSADPGFGSVSGLDRTAMTAIFAERGGDPQRPGKVDPLDALLWQAARPEEPAWESALGHGRPGWHVECTAIALHHLGMDFDVQGGGSDLSFPHHEMSASQAVAAHGHGPFARRYVHAGMVGLAGEKMSKSRGNLVFVSALRAAGHDPMALRLALLAHHYRSDWEWTAAGLDAAEQRLDRWRTAMTAPSGAAAEPVVAALRAALADDLDAPRALTVIDEWAESEGADPAAPAQVADAVDALLGVR
jgi:L-cysteine:1D-myo-inositol 2-amino-2-deoxy-alpha-D-glucopyranoside ligase